jgi:hypothetical protein
MQRLIRKGTLLIVILLGACSAKANLLVTIGHTKTVGRKIITCVEFKNAFREKIESARATLFLVDEDGQVLGRATHWVIGGTKNLAGLSSGSTNTFNFVITSNRNLTTTYLTPKIHFDRIVLDGGKLADLPKDVTIEQRR